MSNINPVSQGSRQTSHTNWMGGTSWDIKNPLTRLRIAASSCFFGEPMYYQEDARSDRSDCHSCSLSPTELSHLRETLTAKDPLEWRSYSPAKLMEKAIDEALDVSVEETLKLAVALRNEDHIRTTPQVILVRAANHKNARGPKQQVKGTPPHGSLVLTYASKIIRRADEPAVGLAYQLSAFGATKPVPNSLKKAWAQALTGTSELNLAKYRMENRVVKTRDVARLVHPAGLHIKKLLSGELTLSDKETWESLISAEGSNNNTWTKAVQVMGHMALLRNLCNLVKHKVEPKLFTEELVKGAKLGKQLPFRYYSAYRALEAVDAPPSVLDAVEVALEVSLANLPTFNGRVMSLCDNSGSAQSTVTSAMGSMRVSTIGNLTGVITGKVSEEGYLGAFGNKLRTMSIRKGSSVFDQLKKAEELSQEVGQATENGVWLFWDHAIKEQEKWDHVFIYSDMQAGHGGLYGTDANLYRDFIWSTKTRGAERYIDVAKLISTYRAKVNPVVMVYLVQIAGYQDTIVPEFYDRTFILGGWGDGILRFASAMSQQYLQK